jgi:putative endonuclease
MYYFYMLRCKDGSLYSGIATNLAKRETTHNMGKGSKYVRSRGGGMLVYQEKYRTHAEAMRREYEVKRWPKIKKELLISGGKKKLKPKFQPVDTYQRGIGNVSRENSCHKIQPSPKAAPSSSAANSRCANRLENENLFWTS